MWMCRLMVTLEVLTTCDVTFLMSSGGKCVFPILGAIPTSGFHRPGKTEDDIESFGTRKGFVYALVCLT